MECVGEQTYLEIKLNFDIEVLDERINASSHMPLHTKLNLRCLLSNSKAGQLEVVELKMINMAASVPLSILDHMTFHLRADFHLQMLKALAKLKIVDQERKNMIVVFTHAAEAAASHSKSVDKQSKKLEEAKGKMEHWMLMVKDTLHETFPHFMLENDLEEVDVYEADKVMGLSGISNSPCTWHNLN